MYVCMYDNIYLFFLRLFCKLLRFPECILPTIMYIYILSLVLARATFLYYVF